MCNRYTPPDVAEIEREWHVGARDVPRWPREVFPRTLGPFIRHAPAHDGRELVVGQWGLVPFFAKAPKLAYQTNNARSEEVAAKPTFRDAWKRGQRCLIPASAFDEPCWETGRNVWWRFRRADGAPWALAGLWNTWRDRETGEFVESYTMLTLNADAHQLMARMHKPDPKLPPDQQDKRSVVAVSPADWDVWLRGTIDEAQALVRLTPVAEFDAFPVDGPGQAVLL